jgi:hypothetical protein
MTPYTAGMELHISLVGRSEAKRPIVYDTPAGNRRLREAIARHIAVSRGVEASADDVIVTNGMQQALDVVARVLFSPGDHIAVEDPGYILARWAFAALGLRVRGVAVDRNGLEVDAIPKQARAVYVTPSHQYPLGVSMTLPRRSGNDDREVRPGEPHVHEHHVVERFGRIVPKRADRLVDQAAGTHAGADDVGSAKCRRSGPVCWDMGQSLPPASKTGCGGSDPASTIESRAGSPGSYCGEWYNVTATANVATHQSLGQTSFHLRHVGFWHLAASHSSGAGDQGPQRVQ